MESSSVLGLIDTHAHLLPYWDDGADSWETSMAMLKQAEEDGIREVVCTPHILSKQDFIAEDVLLGRYQELKDRASAASIDLMIHMGSEIFIHPDLDLSYRIATPAENKRYFLVEFPMSLTPETVAKSFLDVIVKNKIPVIAHPERYLRIVNDPNEVYQYIERGALIQLNAGSIIGTFGQMTKEIASQLLEANLVHLVASDAHDVKARPLRLRKAFQYIASRWGTDRAVKLFYENPKKILNGEIIAKEAPWPLENKKSKWGQYFKSFKKW